MLLTLFFIASGAIFFFLGYLFVVAVVQERPTADLGKLAARRWARRKRENGASEEVDDDELWRRVCDPLDKV